MLLNRFSYHVLLSSKPPQHPNMEQNIKQYSFRNCLLLFPHFVTVFKEFVYKRIRIIVFHALLLQAMFPV